MNKQSIKESLTGKYGNFIQTISDLTEEEYLYRSNGKWTAKEQIEHIILCMKPLLQVFSMNKEALAKTFGRTENVGRTYEDLKAEYIRKLKEGGKAPSRFVPEKSDNGSREELKDMLFALIEELNLKIDNFSEEELDSLLIPHPLLGNLRLREMLYNAIYHVEHHQNQIRQNLLGIK